MVDVEKLNYLLQARKDNEEEIKKVLSKVRALEREEVKRLWQITKDLLPEEQESEKRKLFIMAYSLTFDPCLIILSKIRFGERKLLKEIINCKSAPTISISIKNLLFEYNTYRGVRQKVNDIIKKFEEKK